MLISYRDDGTGPAVLLLHSGVTDSRAWEPQARVLEERRRVLRPDLRGFGDSPLLPPEPYTNHDDLVALLDHLGIESCDVVGASYGGRVALELAEMHPARVRSLALLCPAFAGLEPTPDLEAFGEREGALLEAGDVDGAVELNVRTWLGPEASEEVRASVAGMQRRAFELQLAADEVPDFPWPAGVDVDLTRIAVPTLVVSGDHDVDHFRIVAAYLADTIPAARLVRLGWAGHLPALERPEETTQLLLEFLDQV